MYYINSTPMESGNYGNLKGEPFEGCLVLPDELKDAYLNTMGFAVLTVEGVPVTDEEGNEIGAVPAVTAVALNQAAYDAYQEAHPAPPPPTPAERREAAYNTLEIVEWDGGKITVTAAAQLWEYYAAEGSEKAATLQMLIAAAKAEIREMFPEEETT